MSPPETKGGPVLSFLAFSPFPAGTSRSFNKVENSHKGPYKHMLLDFKFDLEVPLLLPLSKVTFVNGGKWV